MGDISDQSNIRRHIFSTTLFILFSGLAFLFSGCSSGGGGHSASTFILSGIMNGDIQEDVTITLSGAGSSSTTTATNGNYAFEGLADGSYTVTPTLTGYTFTPTSQNVMIEGANASAINFTSTINRSGSGNSDRSISENLAQKRPMNYGQRKEQEDEKDKTESLGKF